MSLNTVHFQRPKSVAEHGACFGVAIIALAAAAVALQWILHLVP
ncbi:MAG: hypothetical protein P4L64_14705 [Caulobacteraceae bacterium]|nr:hypothetical protein [Caulobacteraceae bacterium]